MKIFPKLCAVLTLLRERKILSLDWSLSTFKTLTCSVPIPKIVFGTTLSKSPPTLTKVTIPVTPSDPIPEDVVPIPIKDNVIVDRPTLYPSLIVMNL